MGSPPSFIVDIDQGKGTLIGGVGRPQRLVYFQGFEAEDPFQTRAPKKEEVELEVWAH